MLFGRVGAGKTTLTQALRGEEIKYFKTFLSMAKSLSIKGIGFDGKTPEEIDEIYHSIYSREDEEKYNVVAFKLELL